MMPVIQKQKTALFILSVLVSVAAIKFVGQIPEFFITDQLNHYRSIHEANEHLGFGRVDPPVFFPQNLKWPPDEIYAQKEPYPMVLIHFKGQKTGAITMALQEVYRLIEPGFSSRLEPLSQTHRTKRQIKNKEVEVLTGLCVDGSACQKLVWSHKNTRYSLLSNGATDELIRMVTSMIRP